MRLIGQNGQQMGILWLREALQAAEDAGLDLIEVAPDAKPPVCRIMDWGRYRFEQQRREREQRRKQKTGEVKGLRLRPTTDEHDFGVTRRKAEMFLRAGHKVRVEVRFRGREITHRELGQEMLYRLATSVAEIGEVEQAAAMEGKKMFIMIVPRPEGTRPPEGAAPAVPKLTMTEITVDEGAADVDFGDDDDDDDEDEEEEEVDVK